MIYFLTPLSAQSSVSDWRLVCELLRETLRSLENQVSEKFQSYICCHDIPDFAKELDERFHFILHPFVAPVSALSVEGVNNGVRDGMLKRDVALFHSDPNPDDFVVLLDADDLYHRELVKDLESLHAFDCVLFENGYEFCHKSRRLLGRRDMVSRTCSSFALKAKFLRLPNSLSEDDLRTTLYHDVWHSNVREYLVREDISFHVIESPRVIYKTNTSLNHSDYFRKGIVAQLKQRLKFFFGRKLTSSDREKFGFLKP